MAKRKKINSADDALDAIAETMQWVFDNIAININELDTEEDAFRIHMLKFAKQEPAKFSREARAMMKERQKEQEHAKRLVDDDRAIMDAIGRAEREVISRNKNKWKRWLGSIETAKRAPRVSKASKESVLESSVSESDSGAMPD